MCESGLDRDEAVPTHKECFCCTMTFALTSIVRIQRRRLAELDSICSFTHCPLAMSLLPMRIAPTTPPTTPPTMAPVLLPPELLGAAAAGAGAAGEGEAGLGEVPCPERLTPLVPTPAPCDHGKFQPKHQHAPQCFKVFDINRQPAALESQFSACRN